MPPDNPLKRLPGRRGGVIRRASIWDGGDHLLSITGTVFSERYQRFYYRDISAIVVQNGPRLGSTGALLLLVWGTLTLVFLFTVRVAPPIFHWLWLAPAAWLLLIAYQSIARSCRVFVYTAVSSQELPALFRRSVTKKALSIILTKIQEAQGDFDAAAIQPVLNEAQAPLPEAAVPVIIPQRALYAALICFALILSSGVFAYWYSNTPLTSTSLGWGKVIICVLNALEVITAVWALSKLFSMRLFATVRTMIIAGLGLLALRLYALLIVLTGFSQQRGILTENINTVYLRRWVGTGDAALSTIIAITGLISLLMAWQDDRRGPASSL